jgi:hypothetical protein
VFLETIWETFVDLTTEIVLPHYLSNSIRIEQRNHFCFISISYVLLIHVALEQALFVCVEKCPSSTKLIPFEERICAYEETVTVSNYVQKTVEGKCAAYQLESAAILNRCVPMVGMTAAIADATNQNATTVNSTNPISSILGAGRDGTMRAVADLTVTWPVIAASTGAAIIITFIWMGLLQWFSGVLVWLTIILSNVVFLFGATWLFFFWQSKLAALNGGVYEPLNSPLGSQIGPHVGLFGKTAATKNQVDLLQTAFIIVATVAGILLLLTIGMFKRIRIAVAIIKQAATAMLRMPLIMVFPLFVWTMMLANFAYFIAILCYIVTPTGPMTVSIELFNVVWKDPQINNYVLAYHIFGFLWTQFFLSGINQVTIAGAIASWYWLLDKKQKLKSPVLKALGRTFLYHLGSIAVGSLLIAIVEFIRILLYQIQRKVSKSNNQHLKYLIACLQCFLKIVSILVKFINKNAYIYLAITGKAFFKAAGEATGLLMRNALRTVAVDFVSDFVMFLSKLVVASVTGFISYIYITSYSGTLGASIHEPLVTVVLVAIAAFMVATAFFSVYHMAIDTIFLCFLEDSEKNDGSAERPFYMTEALKNIMGVNNKKIETKSPGKKITVLLL